MIVPSLRDIIDGPFIGCDPVLEDLLIKADKEEHALLYCCTMATRQMNYMNPRCEQVLGYPARDFVRGGAEFFFAITDPTLIPNVIKRQLAYTQPAKLPGFNPRSVIVQKYPVRMITAGKQMKELLSMAIVLTYTTTGEWEFGVAMLVEGDQKVKNQCNSFLKAIKKRHNQIYQHVDVVGDNESLPVVHLTNDRIDKKITPRETEVIKLLANGYSTTKISSTLRISSNTVESHRKKLLQKLDAKNTAELIKKASKVYWLE
jgi:DNA-binding CsgD family transcriptional regulator